MMLLPAAAGVYTWRMTSTAAVKVPRSPHPQARSTRDRPSGSTYMTNKSLRTTQRNNIFKRKALAIAIGSAALGFAGTAWAQATSGTIYGTAPVASGETIQITGGAGYNRTITVGPSGKYSITLPVGTYTVSLLQDGRVVQSRAGVTPAAA
ncbi:MAG: hypothetical protein ACTHM4_14225, partial [Rhodanobacteraceae bacterium]